MSWRPRFLFHLQLWQVTILQPLELWWCSFESPKLYLLTLNSKNIIAALLTPVRIRTCWKVPIYNMNVVLVILIWAALYIWKTIMQFLAIEQSFSIADVVQMKENYANFSFLSFPCFHFHIFQKFTFTFVTFSSRMDAIHLLKRLWILCQTFYI